MSEESSYFMLNVMEATNGERLTSFAVIGFKAADVSYYLGLMNTARSLAERHETSRLSMWNQHPYFIREVPTHAEIFALYDLAPACGVSQRVASSVVPDEAVLAEETPRLMVQEVHIGPDDLYWSALCEWDSHPLETACITRKQLEAITGAGPSGQFELF
jgi:hypothetical protein